MRILESPVTTSKDSSNFYPGAIFAIHGKSFFGNTAIMKSLATLLVLLLASMTASAQTITTVAGDGSSTYTGGDGGPALNSSISPGDVAIDASGNLFVSDGNRRIRKISPGGIINTFAGTGNQGFSGDDGLAVDANLWAPGGLTFDTAGNLYFVDGRRIRKITPAGIISTLAGNGTSSFSGDGGLAIDAGLAGSGDIAVDTAGNLYISDSTTHVIRKITTDGIIRTIVGTPGASGFSGDGGPAIQAKLSQPNSVSIDANGNLYISDSSNHRIRKVSAGGIVTTVAGSSVPGFDGDGRPATSASLYYPSFVQVEPDGSFLVNTDHRLRYVNSAGVISTLAGDGFAGFGGDGGPAALARLNFPRGMAVDSAHSIYIADSGNARIRKITRLVPGAPSITGTMPGNNQMRVNFSAPISNGGSLITGYQVISSPAGGIDTDAGSASLSHLVTGLSNGVNYTFTVTATNAIGTGPASAPSASAAPGNVPSAPLSVNATAGPNQAVVTFNTPANNGALPITSYRVSSSPASPASWDMQAGTNALSHTIANLNKATTYTFTVYATNAAGESVASVASSAVTTPDTPSVPSAPTATMSGGQVQISFSPSSSNGGSAITGYRVTSVPNQVFDTQLTTTRTLTVPPGTYRFYVHAINAVGSSANSQASNTLVVSTVPDAPMISNVAPGNKSASVVIRPPDNDGGSPITGYTVVSTPGGGVDSASGTTNRNRTITGLTNGTSYTFKVRATNAIGTGAFSAASTPITPSSSAQSYLWIGDTQIVEGNSGTKSMVFTISLTKTVGNAVTFDFFTYDGYANSQATPDIDFVRTSLTGLSIPAGTLSTTVSVTINGDTTFERNETFTGNVSSVNGAAVLDDQAMATIFNDEPATSRIESFAGMGSTAFSGDGGSAAQAGMDSPMKMTRDNQGNFYFSDSKHHRIRKINPSGIISTIAGNGTQGFSGDGGLATQAMLNGPSGIVADTNGNIYFSDTGNLRVRKISPAGIITTIAGKGFIGGGGNGGPAALASLNGINGLAIDANGRLFVGEYSEIRVIDLDGVINRYAGGMCSGPLGDGGLAREASLCEIIDMAFDKSGNLFVADHGHMLVRKITPEGSISTVAGNGSYDFADDVPAISTGINKPVGIAVDAMGNLYIAEMYKHRVRKVSPDGIITTIAGDGRKGYDGDGMDARVAGFDNPSDVETDAQGNVYVSAVWDHRIRKIVSLLPGVSDSIVATAGNQQATVVFSPPYTGDTPITGYTVRSIPAGGVDANAGSTVLSHVMTGLTNGIAYTFVVTANSNGGSGTESQPSNSVIPYDASVPQLSINDASITEGNSGARLMTFTINLSMPALAGGVTFDLASSDARGTRNVARAGSDYSAITMTGITIPAGASSTTVNVKIIGDKVAEPDEVFAVTISNLSGANALTKAANGKIINDDNASIADATDSTPEQAGSSSDTNSGVSNPADPNVADASPITAIHDIQGASLISPLLGRNIVTEGIVTARRSDGFFLQASDKECDLDPATSEGIYVFTGAVPSNVAAVGYRVRVSGRVNERIIGDSENALSLTQIISTDVRRVSDRQSLPVATPLTSAVWNARSTYGGLERHEAIRVSIPALKVVSPVGGNIDQANGAVKINGIFYGVPSGVARPFRERGKNLLDPSAISGDTPVFDGNPERILVDSAAQKGTVAIAVDAGDTVKGLVGVLDYADGSYRLSPDPDKSLVVVSAANPRAAHTPVASDITIGEFNLRGLFNDINDPQTAEPVITASAYSLRLAKTANAICAYAKSPDILGVTQVESLGVLSDLAAAVNSHSGNILFPKACVSDPDYRPYLIKGNGVDAVNIGFMVSSAEVRRGVPRVQVLSHQQFGKTAVFSHPNGKTESLYDQPPLLLKARVNHADGQSLEVTVLLAQWQHSAIAADSTEPGENGWLTRDAYTRAKRLAQAQVLARLIHSTQQANPAEKLIVLGGFDASEFGNGSDDLMALVTGKPANAASNSVTSPIQKPLHNMTLGSPKSERYNAADQGNAVAIDHILINQALIDSGYSHHLDYVRLNADFGEDNAGDNAVPMRVSDHDPLILHLSRPARPVKKVSAAANQ